MNIIITTFTLLFFISIQFHSIQINGMKITCRNENGESVDWYYLYKLPSAYKNSHGLKYLYLTSNSKNNLEWKLSNVLINDSISYPGRTLTSIFNDSTILSLAYNDEIPNGKTNNIDGHTKGVIAADFISGFWLIHSVPKYPEINTIYSYPETGTRYGQSFLCITFKAAQINQIAEQLIYNEPNVYHMNFPDKFKNLFPNFTDVSMKKWKRNGPFWSQATLVSAGGTNFLSFAKGRRFKKELYEDWVAPVLNTDLLVETWRNGGGNFPSNCSRLRHVFNVVHIKVSSIDFSFKSTEDHSKWGVAAKNNTNANTNKNWICVGDINRQEHQLERGGGTVCQLNSKVAETYRNLIENYDPCSS